MANYIDQEIICEAYVHLELNEAVTPEEIAKIKNQLKAFLMSVLSFFLGHKLKL